MNVIHYIGLDVHKKSISYCIKTADGRIVREGKLQATRLTLRSWAEGLREPWCGAMEATLFSAWIYDTLKPYAEKLVMGHPASMKAITAGKKKSDTIDARTIADLLRCDLLATCYVLAPEMRDLRRLLRYRNLVVHQSVRMQNKMAGLLMESGILFRHKTKLHGKKYFYRADGQPGRSAGVGERSFTDESQHDGDVRVDAEADRQEAAVRAGVTTARRAAEEYSRCRCRSRRLTWALEVADPQRFSSIGHAVSYCGLTSAFRSSAGKEQRGPISKQRNAWLQTVLIEAAKLAPRWNPQLATLHGKELALGHPNRATLQVARKLVAYLLAVDKSGQPFQVLTPPPTEESATKTKTRKRASMTKAA